MDYSCFFSLAYPRLNLLLLRLNLHAGPELRQSDRDSFKLIRNVPAPRVFR